MSYRGGAVGAAPVYVVSAVVPAVVVSASFLLKNLEGAAFLARAISLTCRPE